MIVLLRTLFWRLVAWDAALSYALTLPDTPAHAAARRRARWVAHLGDSALWFPLVGALWLRARRREPRQARLLVGWLATMLAAAGATLAIKGVLRRERPQAAGLMAGPGADQHSFPSGHAARLAASLAWLRLLNRPAGVLAGLLALAVGFSRVRLGVHFVGDVLAGYMVGSAVSAAVLRVMKRTPARST